MITLDDPDQIPLEPPDASHPFARLLGWATIASPERHGFPTTRQPRHAGVGVHSARTLLGLRAWKDTWEQVDERRACVIFELEKLLRMLLRQSTLAAELIAAITPHDDLPGATLLGHAITRQMPVAYAQTARQTHLALRSHPERVSHEVALDALRHMLTGAVLATQHHLSVHLPTLLTRWGDEDLLALIDTKKTPQPTDSTHLFSHSLLDHFDAILPVLASDSPQNSLPAAPTGYDALHEFLITQRLGAS